MCRTGYLLPIRRGGPFSLQSGWRVCGNNGQPIPLDPAAGVNFPLRRNFGFNVGPVWNNATGLPEVEPVTGELVTAPTPLLMSRHAR